MKLFLVSFEDPALEYVVRAPDLEAVQSYAADKWPTFAGSELSVYQLPSADGPVGLVPWCEMPWYYRDRVER